MELKALQDRHRNDSMSDDYYYTNGGANRNENEQRIIKAEIQAIEDQLSIEEEMAKQVPNDAPVAEALKSCTNAMKKAIKQIKEGADGADETLQRALKKVDKMMAPAE